MVFDLIILAGAIIIFVYGDELENIMGKPQFWSKNNQTIEEFFHCCGWDNITESTNCTMENPVTCHEQVNSKFTGNLNVIGGILIAIFAILLAFIILFFYLACRINSDGEDSDSQKGQFNTPLTYGW